MHDYLVYGMIFAAAACAVFGVAGLLPAASAPRGPSLIRGHSALDRMMAGGSKFVPQNQSVRSKLDIWLVQAGFDSPQALQTYYGVRIALLIGLPVLMFFGLPLVTGLATNLIVATALIAALVGYMLPPHIVGRRRKQRQRQFRDGLPDMLDLLLVCSEAGIGIDMALNRVGHEIGFSHPLMAEQVGKISDELMAGRTRSDAMRAFAERTGIDEVQSLVSLLVQSDALGTSMAATLRAFSEDMRAHRLLKAEEIGHKVTVKLTVVLVTLFLPAIIAAMVAPVAINLVELFSKIHPVL